MSPAASSASLIDSRYAWMRLAVCVTLGSIGSVGMWSVVLILPPVQAEFGIDRADASIPYTLTMLGFAFGNVLIGRLVDRFGVLIPLVTAAVAIGAGYLLASQVGAVWQLALVQGILIGIGTAGTFGPLIADISHWFEKRRGIAVATVASGNYIGGAIWPTFIDGIIAAEGWRFAYIVIGLVCLATMIPLALTLRRAAPVSDAHAADGIAAGALNANMSPRTLQLLLAFAGVACCVAMSMPQVHIVAYCFDLGYGVARGAEMLSLMLAGGVISRLASGFLADYIGGVRTLLIGSVLQGIALMLYLPFDGLASLYIVSLIFGLSQGGIVPSYAIIVREYLPAREAGQRVGIVIMATIIGMALGGWVSGWIYDMTGSYQMAFLHGIIWNGLNVAIMLFVLFRTQNPKAPKTPVGGTATA